MTADSYVKLIIRPAGPFDLPLCLRAIASFSRELPPEPPVFRFPARINGRPSVVETEQSSKRPVRVEVRSRAGYAEAVVKTAEWVLSADLDLRPFYAVADKHAALGPIARSLRGLKPFRVASLFEMAFTAVTEQQISLAAAQSIRRRVIERFGDPVDGLWCFPLPERLATKASQSGLLACGLSHRKAEYITNLAQLVASGKLDLEGLKDKTDEEAADLITSIRGFGSWSANYILIRGLGRPDRVPYNDLGVRTVIGRYLGHGPRMEASEVEQALAPLAPFRGLAAFYVIVHHRLNQGYNTRAPR